MAQSTSPGRSTGDFESARGSLTRYIDETGAQVAQPPTIECAPDKIVPLYRAMVLTRLFDEKAVALQRTGRLGTYASSLGQEAVGVGAASAMRASDVLLPSFREQGAMLWRGVQMSEILAYWGGDERGSDFAGPREDFPVCIPVASQFPHAAGVALAMKLRGEDRAAVVIGGDGATSKGDFYEAMNIAGVWGLPMVIVINNNHWAISVPLKSQTAAQSLAAKAAAAGIAGERVDGNDVIAVHDATKRALTRARSGAGPTLVECVTYRLGDHTTADDARRYRASTEVTPHWRAEPISRLRNWLAARGNWTKQLELDLLAQARTGVDQAAEAYLAIPPAPATDMIDHQYASLPAALADQRAALAAAGSRSDG
jgi:pyruvate dehydrogenase E1 component alpha subunit